MLEFHRAMAQAERARDAHIRDSKAHSILVREIVEAANGMERVLESLGLLLIGEAAAR